MSFVSIKLQSHRVETTDLPVGNVSLVRRHEGDIHWTLSGLAKQKKS
jgi:hypothetical protein